MKIRVFGSYGKHHRRKRRHSSSRAKRPCKFGRVKSGPRKGRCRLRRVGRRSRR